MKNEIIEIAVCLDKGFIIPSSVMMNSVCANNQDYGIVFHVITDESVTEKEKKELRDNISEYQDKSIRFYSVSSLQTDSFPMQNENRLPLSTYYRLFLADILDVSTKKILYLDGDCIVRHSLSQLWETDLTGYALAAVFDVSEGDIEFYNRLRYSPSKGYFNAGVMLINLDYWRQHSALTLFTDYLGGFSKRIKHCDQDVLNVVFQDEKIFLHAKYNLQTGFLRDTQSWDYWKHEEELMAAIKDPVIVHFTSWNKPWYSYTQYPHPYRSSFYKYQQMSKWKNYRIDKRTLKVKLKNFIGDSLRKLKLRNPVNTHFIKLSPID